MIKPLPRKRQDPSWSIHGNLTGHTDRQTPGGKNVLGISIVLWTMCSIIIGKLDRSFTAYELGIIKVKTYHKKEKPK